MTGAHYSRGTYATVTKCIATAIVRPSRPYSPSTTDLAVDTETRTLNKSLSAAAAPGYRLGPLEFATGMTGRNAWTYLYVCLAIMPVISFLSVSQPYVLTEIIGIPPEKDGQVTGLLITMHEIVLLGLQDQPFSPLGYLGCVLVGIGQMSVILSVTGLLGQETPVNVRGSVIGLAGLCGSVGILVTSLAGGYLFDYWKISVPIILVGVANLVAFVFALIVWLRSGRPVRFDPSGARSSSMLGLGAH